jgi:DNA (cytosine-5)-methyltransferase 1
VNGLDLFSGIGGITKALEGYVRPVAYCENDKYAQAVLLSRMREGTLPQAPVWDDIRTLQASLLPDGISIIYGGFPCQDISVANTNGVGITGKRSGLFFEIIRLVGEMEPRFVFLENVAVITVRGAERVVAEFHQLGYDCRWGTLSAAEVGANHIRNRWWLLANSRRLNRRPPPIQFKEATPFERTSQRPQTLAHSKSQRPREARELRYKQSEEWIAWNGEEIPDSDSTRCKEPPQSITGETQFATPIASSSSRNWWKSEPDVGRVAHGVPMRVDRLRGLGNAVVPAQAREAFERLMGFK